MKSSASNCTKLSEDSEDDQLTMKISSVSIDDGLSHLDSFINEVRENLRTIRVRNNLPERVEDFVGLSQLGKEKLLLENCLFDLEFKFGKEKLRENEKYGALKRRYLLVLYAIRLWNNDHQRSSGN